IIKRLSGSSEHISLFAQLAGGWRDDSSAVDPYLFARRDGSPHILFADEIINLISVRAVRRLRACCLRRRRRWQRRRGLRLLRRMSMRRWIMRRFHVALCKEAINQ